jgi:hypothetical protein
VELEFEVVKQDNGGATDMDAIDARDRLNDNRMGTALSLGPKHRLSTDQVVSS